MTVISPGVRERVDRALALLRSVYPDLHSANVPAGVSPVTGGITNQNFRVTFGELSLFLRLAGEGTGALGIDRGRERRCHLLASERGLAPPLVLTLPDDVGFFASWIEGRSGTRETLADPGNLARLGLSLRRLHTGPAFPEAPGPFEAIRGYQADLGEQEPRGPEALALWQELQGYADVAGQLENALVPAPGQAPCHNDLTPGNLIDDGERLWLVDWEYARQGDPFMDLGTLAANLGLDAEGSALLLEAWRGWVAEEDQARMGLMAAVSDLRDAWWCLRQAGLSTLETDYPALSAAYLASLCARVTDPRFEQDLALLG